MYRIIEEYGNYSFLMRNEYTGMKYQVTVSDALRHLFDDKTIFNDLPEACPFFRKNYMDGLWYCTVHLTRPDVCREYGCWRFLILDKQGKQAGKVMGTRHLHTTDPNLAILWEKEIRALVEPDDTMWDRLMQKILNEAEYEVKN